MAFSWNAIVRRILSLTAWVVDAVTRPHGWPPRGGGEIRPYADLARSSDRTVVTSQTGSNLSDIANTIVLESMSEGDMYYKLNGHTVVPATRDEYLIAHTARRRTVEHGNDDPWRVAYDELELDGGTVVVSTVFLGMEHGFDEHGPPIVFETLIQGGEMDDTMQRYSSWDEAADGHHDMLQEVLLRDAEREAKDLDAAFKKHRGVVEYKTERKIRLRKK